MNDIILNHPYRDTGDGGIVIPKKIEKKHNMDSVYYTSQDGLVFGVMPLKTWLKYCVPITFETQEGP